MPAFPGSMLTGALSVAFAFSGLDSAPPWPPGITLCLGAMPLTPSQANQYFQQHTGRWSQKPQDTLQWILQLASCGSPATLTLRPWGRGAAVPPTTCVLQMVKLGAGEEGQFAVVTS